MDFDNWHWPQWVLGALMVAGLDSIDENWQGAFLWAIVLLATYAGGFWG